MKVSQVLFQPNLLPWRHRQHRALQRQSIGLFLLITILLSVAYLGISHCLEHAQKGLFQSNSTLQSKIKAIQSHQAEVLSAKDQLHAQQKRMESESKMGEAKTQFFQRWNDLTEAIPPGLIIDRMEVAHTQIIISGTGPRALLESAFQR
ncbi:MAG: hypothetical protein EBX40_08430, partial [Gammaproteobacteria bacterium]|nr:hypothetical protein [Gammaproteobacteria bacterium]